MTTSATIPITVTANQYALLVAYGFSPTKAAEIVLDAKRGDPYAIEWLNIVLKQTKDPRS